MSAIYILLSYCYDKGIPKESRIFPITRSQVFRIVEAAYKAAGIRQPSKVTNHVDAVHVLRHSGAIARQKASGNPKGVQHQLRHKNVQMTPHYMKTMSAGESLTIQKAPIDTSAPLLCYFYVTFGYILLTTN
jgi:integrase